MHKYDCTIIFLLHSISFFSLNFWSVNHFKYITFNIEVPINHVIIYKITKPCIIAYTVSFMFHHISFCACMTLQCILYFHLRQKAFKGIKAYKSLVRKNYIYALKTTNFLFARFINICILGCNIDFAQRHVNFLETVIKFDCLNHLL